ncbi:hypothetical protein HPB52_021273 [Rhipicephalus sanguineus]|uniref:Uncharacterized protein n=1 Tax=Rhipicephalus sanguineus TaxID=34632 RepID=A0A9D4Q5J2_RHISA|nr:hypothetical protein HPB52_021273 [Rhipicephalus sanguineus]
MLRDLQMHCTRRRWPSPMSSGSPVHVQPPGTGLPLFVGLVTRHREACPHGRNMDRPRLYRPSRGLDVASPLGDPAPPLLGDPPLDAPAVPWTPSLRSAPDRAIAALHGQGDQDPLPGLRNFPPRPQDGSLHRRPASLRQQSGTPSFDHRNHRQLQQPSRPPSLSFARPPDLLAQGVLPAPTSVPPPTLPPQPPSMTCSISTNEPLLIEGEGVVWVSPFALDKEDAIKGVFPRSASVYFLRASADPWP